MTQEKIIQSDRFVRWQNVLREHLTFLNNLVLTFSIGIIGFIISLLDNKDFIPTCCQKIFLTSGLILTFLSLVLGFFTSFSRLYDFRTTVKKIRNEMTSNFSEQSFLNKLMDIYKKTTWALFYSQIIVFCIAIFSLIIFFLMKYNEKLF